jgi:hypothetical protein
MKYLIRPLTERMVIKLKECREMELEGSDKFCPPEHFNNSLPGLYARGLIGVRKYSSKGKDLMGVFVTAQGIELLKQL